MVALAVNDEDRALAERELAGEERDQRLARFGEVHPVQIERGADAELAAAQLAELRDRELHTAPLDAAAVFADLEAVARVDEASELRAHGVFRRGDERGFLLEARTVLRRAAAELVDRHGALFERRDAFDEERKRRAVVFVVERARHLGGELLRGLGPACGSLRATRRR